MALLRVVPLPVTTIFASGMSPWLEEEARTIRLAAGFSASPIVKVKRSVTSSLTVRLTTAWIVGAALTLVVMMAVLFVAIGSAVVLTATARFVIVPAVGQLTRIVAVTLAPLAMEPS